MVHISNPLNMNERSTLVKPVSYEQRKNIIQTALLDNHDRVTQLHDVRLVRFAFLVNDPEGRHKLTSNQAAVHARLLKSLFRIYLNKYRRRRSGKRVLGYSWVMHSEQYCNKPYLHIVFYVSPDTYDELMLKPHSETITLPSDSLEPNAEKDPEKALSIISDIGYYWTIVCHSNGLTGAAISYNLDKGRSLLSHGEHSHITLLEDYDILADLNGDQHTVLLKLDISDKRVYVYFRQIAQEAYFLPKERSFGVSYSVKKQISKN